MYPKLFTLYGPFELNSYNTAIMIGIVLFLYLANRNPARALLMSSSEFFNLCIESALFAILGARVLHVLSSLDQYPSLYSMVSIWDGGLSILGALIAVFCYSYWALIRKGIPFFSVTDLAALYLPLVHAFGRIGCFLVGCCYGAPTDLFCAVTYTNPQVMAPLHSSLHPSQLYSSALYFLLFFALMKYAQSGKVRPTGSTTLLYIMGMSLERFIVDFVRGDRIMNSSTSSLFFSPLSFYQWIAVALFVAAGAALMGIRQTSGGGRQRPRLKSRSL